MLPHELADTNCGCGCMSGPQCETVVGVFRCILTDNHFGQQCESYNVNDQTVMLGIYPAEVVCNV